MTTDYFGNNELNNGDAESGSVAPWVSSGGLSVVSGGNDSYCFSIDSGDMVQTVSPDEFKNELKVSGKFLPSVQNNSGTVKIILNYSDSTKDEHSVPCEV